MYYKWALVRNNIQQVSKLLLEVQNYVKQLTSCNDMYLVIGPESDHCLPLSLTHSLTHSLTN